MVGPAGLEPATPALSTRCSNQLSYGPDNKWWSQTDSNRRHPACKAGALPTELWPRKVKSLTKRLCKSLKLLIVMSAD